MYIFTSFSQAYLLLGRKWICCAGNRSTAKPASLVTQLEYEQKRECMSRAGPTAARAWVDYEQKWVCLSRAGWASTNVDTAYIAFKARLWLVVEEEAAMHESNN